MAGTEFGEKVEEDMEIDHFMHHLDSMARDK